MNRHDYYYEPEDTTEQEERLQQEIDYMVKNDPDYDFTDIHNFGEAIQECGADNQAIIRDYIQQKDWAKLGLKLYTLSLEYQERHAEYKLT